MTVAEHDLRHLLMVVTPYARFNYQVRRIIAFFLYNTPLANRALALLNKTTTHLVNIDRAYRQTLEFKEKMHATEEVEKAQQFGAGFGYESSFREVEVADHYRHELAIGDIHNQPTESGALYDVILKLLGDTISKRRIGQMLDFGVSFGHTDGLLAKQFPATTFWGIDRSEITKFYNEQFFALDNLHFVAGDIFDFMASHSWHDSVLFHMRTLTCLPQAFVEKLYAAAAAAGFDTIVGAEQCGISWQTGKPYEFSLQDQESVAFRNYMYIHNYPGILNKYGYELTQSQLIQTNHPDPNFRLVAFVAVRKK